MPFNQQGELPPTAATGQGYGEAGDQIASQEQVPMAPPPGGGAGVLPPVGGAVDPGGFGLLEDPSPRTSEPVTTGIPSGPGAGPEALHMTPTRRGQDLLRQAAAETQDPFLLGLIERMNR